MPSLRQTTRQNLESQARKLTTRYSARLTLASIFAILGLIGQPLPSSAAAPAELLSLDPAFIAPLAPLSAIGLDPAPSAPPGLLMATHQAGKKGSGSGKSSGVGWRSGAACHSSGFDSWRGRASDAHNHFSGRSNFREVVRLMQGSWLKPYANKPGVFSLGLALLTNDTRGKFGDCNAGKFDNHFRDIGRALKSHGLGDAVIRLGWEANGKGFPWFAGNQPEAYKNCFRRQVKNLKSQAPGLKIEWTMRKDNGLSYSVEKIYPGNDVVDIIGLLYYDRWPSVKTEAQWKASVSETKQGGPKGIGTYLQFAKSRGKKLAVPEWAVSDGHNDRSSTDNPFFIEKMHQFFKANAGSIAYETYYNCNPGNVYKIYPSHHNPKAAAKYQQLW